MGERRAVVMSPVPPIDAADHAVPVVGDVHVAAAVNGHGDGSEEQ
jgi:hypothetical protein